MLEAGKHVLIEKPLTTDVDEAAQIVAAARRAGVKAMVDFAQRWNPYNLTVKEAMLAGELGKPIMAYTRVSDALSVATKWFSWSARSGPQWFLYPHSMDLVRWLFEQEPVQVYAVGHKGVLRDQGIDTYDAIQAIVSYDGGAFATFETSWVVPDSWPSVVDARYSIYGTLGKAEVELDRAGVEVSGPQKHAYPWVPVGRKNLHGKLDSFIYEGIRHFIDCVAEDRAPAATVEDGLVNTATIAAAVRSIEEGRQVPIELPVAAGARG
jgi:predicted dehydrogenase